MNFLDYILVAILAYCLIRGVFRGLVNELSSIVGVLGGFYFAYSYYPQLAAILSSWITNGSYANIVAFLILFVGVYLVISITGAVIKYLISIVFLGWTDRVGGALFGAAKGGLIVIVVVTMLVAFLPKNAEVLRDSLLVRHTMSISAMLVQVTAVDMKTLFESQMKELRQTWQRKVQ
jgi:membrane protein required for colicin V production